MNVTVNTHPTLVSAAEQFENTVNCVMRPCRYMYTILPLAGIPFPKCTRSLVYRIQKLCIVAEKSQEGLQWEWHHSDTIISSCLALSGARAVGVGQFQTILTCLLNMPSLFQNMKIKLSHFQTGKQNSCTF